MSQTISRRRFNRQAAVLSAAGLLGSLPALALEVTPRQTAGPFYPLDPDVQGIGIMRTDAQGRYGFKTIKPAPYPLSAMGESGMRPRHIHFKVAHEGAGKLTTQMYFAGDPLIADDGVMRNTPEPLRHLLITQAQEDADTGLPLHWFEITLG